MAVPHPPPAPPWKHALKKHGLYLSLAPVGFNCALPEIRIAEYVQRSFTSQVTVAVNEKGFDNLISTPNISNKTNEMINSWACN